MQLDLATRYAEPWRRYHTAEHVEEVLAVVERLADLAVDLVAVRLAAELHDAVYDPARSDNEEASAQLALAVLGDSPMAEEVARLVRLTATHVVAGDDANGAVLCDADLSVLGAPPERYHRYVADVRAEYAFVADDRWRTGRASVLEGFLVRPRIYATDRLHDELEARARANLATELSEGGGGRRP